MPHTTADLVASSVLSSLQFKYTLQELWSPQFSATKSFPSGTIKSTCSNNPSSSDALICVIRLRATEVGTACGGCTTFILAAPVFCESSQSLSFEQRELSAFTLFLLGSWNSSRGLLTAWAGTLCPAVADRAAVRVKSLLSAASSTDTCIVQGKAGRSEDVPHKKTSGGNINSGKRTARSFKNC